MGRRISIDEVPPHRRISSTAFVVDFFSAAVDGSTHNFLSHFHADHYFGLRKAFEHPVLCSATTAALVTLRTGARCTSLEMYTVYSLDDDSSVQCIEAHHCPGAVCFLFRVRDRFFLHTGDFKAMECFYSPETSLRFSKIYVDNTYEGFRDFMGQTEAIHAVLRNMEQMMDSSCLAHVEYEWYFCTYLVGKEKLFLSVAEHFDMDVCVDGPKMRIYECFSEYSRSLLNKSVAEAVEQYSSTSRGPRSLGFTVARQRLKTSCLRDYPTPDSVAADRMPFDRICLKSTRKRIHVVSPAQLSKTKINKTLEQSRADRVVVFFGTGWRNGSGFQEWRRGDGKTIKKGIETVYVPYSEHSSAAELEAFRTRMVCDEFVNTVVLRRL